MSNAVTKLCTFLGFQFLFQFQVNKLRKGFSRRSITVTRFIGECTERTVQAYIHSSTELPLNHGSGLRNGRGLVQQFGDESEVIKDLNHFEAHDKIIMGGTVGDNITVKVEPRREE